MDTVIRLRSWIRWAWEDPEPLTKPPLIRPSTCFFFFFLASSRPSVSSIFCLGMPQFWHQRSEVSGPREPIPLPLADALSLWFTSHAGPCRSAVTQPSFKARVGYAGASLAGRRVLSSASGRSSPRSPVYLKVVTLRRDPLAASEHNESELQTFIPVRDSTITINPVLMIHFGQIMSHKQLEQI